MREKLRIIITGGTFDKRYDPLRGELTFSTTHLPEIIAAIRPTLPIELEINQLIDSLEMGDEQRRSVVTACAAAAERHIVVTHGTDTMTETARMLGQAAIDKTIVLTGAMVPYAVAGSDAVFNLGCAVAAATLLPPGVYVAMNARIFRWDDVRKDRETGHFRSLSGEE